MKRSILVFVIALMVQFGLAETYYVSLQGDKNNTGTEAAPWATITHALDNISDGDTVLVKAGTYNGRVSIRGSFKNGVVVKSEVPYKAKLRNNDRVVTAYKHNSGCNGITIEGFDIAHSGPGASALVVHIDGGGDGSVYNITLKKNILHDSYNNDVAKINNSCYNIYVQGNLFFNQTGSDEHIDGNSVENLLIEDNIFLNDYASSGRKNDNSTSSYIVIKDSNGESDLYTGSRNVTIRRNVFLNWEGSAGSNFVLLGEDGNPFHEANGVLVENNLMLGNSDNLMRAPFGIKGCKNVTFRNNTISGNTPANAFAFRFNRESENPAVDSIYLYNNIWSDPTGSMDDFSDTPEDHTAFFSLDNNCYWNGGTAIPENSSDMINYTDDANSITGDPLLGDQGTLVVPHYSSQNDEFADGSTTIREAFVRLVTLYGTPAQNSVVLGAADAESASEEDILGNSRTTPDMGAVQVTGVGIIHGNNQGSGLGTSSALSVVSLAAKKLQITTALKGGTQFSLRDLSGRVVYEQALTAAQSTFTIDLTNQKLSTAVYVAELKSETMVVSGKVVVW